MKYIFFKICLIIAALFGGVAAASDLPDCPNDTNVLWNNCFGTYTYADGGKYVGEWKGRKMNGQGTYTSKDRTIREGIWEDDEFLGTVAEVERAERTRIAAEEKAERIYNACLLDKGADVDMSVSSLESALKATCRSIAKDPSIIENFRYN